MKPYKTRPGLPAFGATPLMHTDLIPDGLYYAPLGQWSVNILVVENRPAFKLTDIFRATNRNPQFNTARNPCSFLHRLPGATRAAVFVYLPELEHVATLMRKNQGYRDLLAFIACFKSDYSVSARLIPT